MRNLPGPALEAQFVEACNRLAERSNGRAVLVFEVIGGEVEEPLDGACSCQVIDAFHPLPARSAHGLEELVDIQHTSDESPLKAEGWNSPN